MNYSIFTNYLLLTNIFNLQLSLIEGKRGNALFLETSSNLDKLEITSLNPGTRGDFNSDINPPLVKGRRGKINFDPFGEGDAK